MAEMTPERLAMIGREVENGPHYDTNPPTVLVYLDDLMDLIMALRKAWTEVEHARKELVFEAQQHMAEVMGCKTNGHVLDERGRSCVNCCATLSGLEAIYRERIEQGQG